MTTPSPSNGSLRGQGRDLLLTAAREVFAEKGFARAGIREIAARAGVTEPNIYWHFKSKRGLFEAAVSEPFARFVEEFFGAWRRRPPGERSAIDEATEYLTGLYQVLQAESDLLLAMIADRQFSSDSTVATALHATVGDLLRLHEELLGPELAKRGYRQFSVRAWTRIFFGTVLSLAIHRDLLEVDGAIDTDEFIRELAEMAIYGAHEPPPTPT
jgi:AcrR family transcriptional regulator